MALIECKECHKQVSSNAKTCPQCGAKVPHRSLAKILVVVLGLVVFIGMVISSGRNETSPTTDTIARPSPVIDSTPHWLYTTSQDNMTQKPIKGAGVDSINELQFDFPYRGAQHATLMLRIHPRFGKDVVLKVERGQFLCGMDDCSMMVRFDGGKPQQFTASEPSDHGTTTLFIRNYDRFVASLRKSKRVFIEAKFYQEGNQVLEFDTTGLNW